MAKEKGQKRWQQENCSEGQLADDREGQEEQGSQGRGCREGGARRRGRARSCRRAGAPGEGRGGRKAAAPAEVVQQGENVSDDNAQEVDPGDKSAKRKPRRQKGDATPKAEQQM